MKKVTLILMVLVISVLLLTSCTDQSKELEERIENENIEVFNVDKRDIERPGEQGGS